MSAVKSKKRHGSKKTKKGWRKCDIQDVEDFLEDKRLEERLGVAFKDRKDEDLFTIDTAPNPEYFEKYEDYIKARRNKILSQPPKCYKSLENDSKVADPLIKRNRVRSAEERKNLLVRLKEADREAKGILKAREISRLQDRQRTVLKKKQAPKHGEFTTDLWAGDKSLPGEMNSEWVLQAAKLHNVAHSKLKNDVIKYSKRIKPSKYPAIEAPHSGVSYNPSFAAYSELVGAVASKEMELIKKEEHLNRVTRSIFTKIPEAQAEAEYMKEMSQGVPALDPEAAKPDEGNPTDNEFKAINPPITRDKKKDLKTRRKAREEQQKRAAIKLAKIEKKKISDLHILKYINKDLVEAEEKSSLLGVKRKAALEAREGTTRRLGPLKFQERELDFNLPSDLTGSLRSIKPEGNLLADRFASFQKRNIMAVPILQAQKSAKVKRYQKPGHKMEWEINPYERPGYVKRKAKKEHQVLGEK